MFDMSWGEILVIGGVALIAIGPKDLPKTLRALGTTVGKLKRMAGEFQSQFQEAMREADLEELKKAASDVTDSGPSINPFEPLQNIADDIQKAVENPATLLPPVFDDEAKTETAAEKQKVSAKPKKAAPKASNAKPPAEKAPARKVAATTTSEKAKPRKTTAAKTAKAGGKAK
ncbi:Sec-independent protein translocase protein TatB [Microvirga sp. W0021]|uniref:Sec-independent protein translocase protein TatB n=1 Tax=Hohaiivirga grylli TaxID=3133970 RepID=A0ABV0BKX2_9HYPH